MEQALHYLIDYLWREAFSTSSYTLPESLTEQFALFRRLVNRRPALPISDTFLKVQDDFLTKWNVQDVTNMETLQPIQPQIYVWRGDITTLRVDAIVNAANSELCGCFIEEHDCIDNIIHTKAGVQLRQACAQLMAQQARKESVGNAKLTSAYNLPSQYILHTVGPVIKKLPVSEMNRALLAKCYLSCLQLADEKQLASLAFCCISTGIFGFPKKEAATIAVETVTRYLAETSSSLKVVFSVFTDEDEQFYHEILERR